MKNFMVFVGLAFVFANAAYARSEMVFKDAGLFSGVKNENLNTIVVAGSNTDLGATSARNGFLRIENKKSRIVAGENTTTGSVRSSNKGFYYSKENTESEEESTLNYKGEIKVTLKCSSGWSVCDGNEVVFAVDVANVPNGSAVSYKWFVSPSSTPVAGVSGSLYTYKANAGNTQMVQQEVYCDIVVNGVTYTTKGQGKLTITPKPAKPTMTANTPVAVGAAINLKAGASVSGATYMWSGPNNFGSNTNTSVSSLTATSASAGTYSLKLLVNGCFSDPATAAVTVTGSSPTPSSTDPSVSVLSTFESTQNKVCKGAKVSFIANLKNVPTTASLVCRWYSGTQLMQTTQNKSDFTIDNMQSTTTVKCELDVTTNGVKKTITSAPITVTVSTPPATPVLKITPNPANLGDNITLTCGAIGGATYQFGFGGSVGMPVSTPSHKIMNIKAANAGMYTVSATVNGCTSAKGSATLIINGAPNPNPGNTTAVSISTPNLSVCSNTVTSFTATPSNLPTGASPLYSWFIDGGAVPVFTSTTTKFDYTPSNNGGNGPKQVQVVCKMKVNGSDYISSVFTLMVKAKPAIPVLSSNSPVSVGGILTLTTAKVQDAYYFWELPTGSGASSLNIQTRNPAKLTDAGTYKVSLIVNGCQGDAGSTTVVINPASNVAGVTIKSSDSDNKICTGESVTFTATPNALPNGASPMYKWYVGTNTTPVQVNSNPMFTTSTLANGDVVKCVMSAMISGAIQTFTSNAIATLVTAKPTTPQLSSNSPVANGSTITLSTTAVNGASYLWTGPANYMTTSTIPSTSVAASASTGGTYGVKISLNGCESDAGSTTVTVTTGGATNSAISITSSDADNKICAGESVTFTAKTENAPTNVAYQWKMGTTVVGVGMSYQTTNLADGQPVVCVMIIGGSTLVNSNAISTKVTAKPATPSIIQTSPNIAVGTLMNLQTSTVAGATYNWSGPGGFTTSTATPAIAKVATTSNMGTYKVQVVKDGCMSAFGEVKVALGSNTPGGGGGGTPTNPYSVTIKSNDTDNSIYEGTAVTFTAKINGDTQQSVGTAFYKWYIGTSTTQANVYNSETFTPNQVTNGMTIKCVVVLNKPTGSYTLTSNVITMKVTTGTPVPAAATITISTTDQNKCQNTPMTIKYAATGSMSLSSVTWYVNDVIIGYGGSSITKTTFKNGDKIRAVLTYIQGGVTKTANSNTVVVIRANCLMAPENTGATSASNMTKKATAPIDPESSIQKDAADLKAIESHFDCQLFPNPTTGKFTITFENAAQTDFNIEIRNTLGQVVYKERCQGDAAIKSKEFDLSEQGKGAYYVTISSELTQKISKIIVN